jgi:hypothetical protein
MAEIIGLFDKNGKEQATEAAKKIVESARKEVT